MIISLIIDLPLLLTAACTGLRRSHNAHFPAKELSWDSRTQPPNRDPKRGLNAEEPGGAHPQTPDPLPSVPYAQLAAGRGIGKAREPLVAMVTACVSKVL